MVSSAGRALVVVGGVGLILLAAWLPRVVRAAPADAPAETVAGRDRDEDLRGERFLPLTAAALGIVGVVVASRLRAPHIGRWIRLAAPLLALVLSLGPLAMIEPR